MLFYTPKNSVAADVIPFHKDGQFHLFYLRDFRDIPGHGEGTPWHHLQTRDFVNYKELGEAVARGGESEQDLYIFTGSVFENAGRYYIFYTGHNPHYQGTGKPCEVIMMAESDDLVTWKKNPDFALRAPDWYEPDDWRDPFVFRHPEKNTFVMLTAARAKDGASRRRGCTAWAESADLIHWEVSREPFFAPRRYFTHECPDLFRMGDWWYLLFSEFSDKTVTRYVMSKSCFGPWVSPENDTFDNSIFYAAKTASDGQNRYLFGWNRTRAGDADDGAMQWGGSIVVHKVTQNEDGTLATSMPEGVAGYFNRPSAPSIRAVEGVVQAKNGELALGGDGGFSAAALGRISGETLLEAEVKADGGAFEFGALLHADERLEEGYYLKFESAFRRVSLDRWPRGDRNDSALVQTEKLINIQADTWHKLQIIVSGALVETYLDGKYAMSARAYWRRHGNLGFYCANGALKLRNITISTPDR